MLTTNETDFLAVVAWITTAKSLPPMVDAALQRLQAQQVAKDDDPGKVARVKAEAARRQEALGPLNGNGLLYAPDPSAQSDGERRRDFLEQAKKPTLPPKEAA